jgi:hypothetical protein
MTPDVMFIGHLLGTRAVTVDFNEQHVLPTTQPKNVTFKVHGAL